jgi:hypothetical protein
VFGVEPDPAERDKRIAFRSIEVFTPPPTALAGAGPAE